MRQLVRLKGKVVGEIVEDTYITQRRQETHYYRTGRGYPISTAILNLLALKGVRYITIVELAQDGIKSYRANLSAYKAALPFVWGDYDEQKVIPLSEMERL